MVAAGDALGHYRILKLLGRGGMGEVFLARDELLDRKVALKFLSPGLEDQPTTRQRFPLEAKAAAQLDHPFVCKVYEAGETAGQQFIAMEYVEGQTLAERLKQGPLTLQEACQIAAEALEAAHEHGIIHRDLKPANVMLTAGHAKVMDFGLAKLVYSRDGLSSEADTESHHPLTQPGVAVGTLAYMSPEQAQGKPATARSDIFSFGVLLHELVTGRHPFLRPSPLETVSAILRDEPPAVQSTSGRVPAPLREVLRRSLAKRPEDRYEQARQLASDLSALRSSTGVRDTRRAATWLGAATLVGLIATGAWWLSARSGGPESVDRPRPLSVLVADFDNGTGEEIFGGVLEQAVTISLESASFITAFPRSRAREVATTIDPSAKGLSAEAARLVAQREGIAALVKGRIDTERQGYRIEVEAVDGVSGNRLAAHARSVARKEDVLQAVGELVVRARQDLGDVVPDAVQAAASETFTASSLEAARSYAQAQELMAVGKWGEAVPAYQYALQLDPTFGRAYAGLAVCHLNLNRTEEARRYYEKAFSLIDRMTDREKHRTRGGYYLLVRNYAKAAEEYGALVEDYPSDPAGPTNLAFAYFQARDMRRALETGRLAVDAHPANVLARANLALYAMYAGDFAAASREADAVLAANPGYETAYVAAAMAHIDGGDLEGARQLYDRLRARGAYGASLAATGMADLALFQGRMADAIHLLKRGIDGDRAAGLDAEAARKHTMVAAARLARGESKPAAEAALQALALSGRHYIQLSAGLTLAAAGQRQRAQQLAESLASQIEPEPRSFGKIVEGELRYHEGQLREAAARFREANEILDTWLGRFLLGRAYLEAAAFTEAYSELEICLKRRGEATALFLDDVPSYHLLPPVHYYMGRAQEGLGSPAAAASYSTFLALRSGDQNSPIAVDARARQQRRAEVAAQGSGR